MTGPTAATCRIGRAIIPRITAAVAALASVPPDVVTLLFAPPPPPDPPLPPVELLLVLSPPPPPLAVTIEPSSNCLTHGVLPTAPDPPTPPAPTVTVLIQMGSLLMSLGYKSAFLRSYNSHQRHRRQTRHHPHRRLQNLSENDAVQMSTSLCSIVMIVLPPEVVRLPFVVVHEPPPPPLITF